MRKFFAICLACLLMPLASWAIDDGSYYLYNVGAKMYMNQGGNPSDNTTANYMICLKQHGDSYNIAASGEGYSISYPLTDGTRYLNADGNTKASTDATAFTFTEQADGTYTIHIGDNYLGYSGTKGETLSTTMVKMDCTADGGDNIKWQLITKDQLAAKLAAATETNPVDATFYVPAADANRHSSYLASSFSGNVGNGYCTGYQSNNEYYIRIGSAEVGNIATASLSLTDMRPGLYTVDAQAVYEEVNAHTGAIESAVNNGTFTAGDKTIAVKGIYDEYAATDIFTNTPKNSNNAEGKYYPTIIQNDYEDACAAFDYDMYHNTISDVEVGVDGKLTISFSVNASAVKYSNLVFDNVTLSYKPLATITDEMVSSLKGITLPTGAMNADVKSSMTTAVENVDATPSSFYAAYNSIDAAKASVAAYATVAAALAKAEDSWVDEVKTSFESAVATIKAGYDAGTLTGDCKAEVAAVKKAVEDAKALNLAYSNDRTALVKNPQFNDGTNGWTVTTGKIEVKATSSGNPVVTAYGYPIDVNQTIEGLAPGVYKLQVQAFAREKANADIITDIANGITEFDNYAYIYGNDESQLVKHISYYYAADNSISMPNSSTEASTAFSSGSFDNEVLCYVYGDGKLKLGIKNISTSGTTYVGYDNFRLSFVRDLTVAEYKTVATKDLTVKLNVNCQSSRTISRNSSDVAYSADGAAHNVVTDFDAEYVESMIGTATPKYYVHEDAETLVEAADGQSTCELAESDGGAYLTKEGYYGSYSNGDPVCISYDGCTAEWYKHGTDVASLAGTSIPTHIYLVNPTTCQKIDYNVTIQLVSSLQRTTRTGSEYGTICMPYEFTVNNAELYTISNIDNAILVLKEEGTTGAAGISYIYKATSADATVVVVADNSVDAVASPSTANAYITGVFEDTDAPEGSYVLQTQAGVQAFYKVGSEVTPKVPAYHAYLNKIGDVDYDEVKIVGFDSNDADAIKSISNNNVVKSGAIYNLNGQQMNKLQKGINIVNGKKYFVK